MADTNGRVSPSEEFDGPLEAIAFYMDKKGMTRRDLVPIIGSRSKVSEVLSGKRSITMPMARALHRHLGIPAVDLLKEPTKNNTGKTDDIEWRKFPLRQMAKREWIEQNANLEENAEQLIRGLMQRAGSQDLVTALYRKNDQNRANAKTDTYALNAWCWQVIAQAREREWAEEYRPHRDPEQLMREVARLSPSTDGPVRAVEYLRERGIAVEIVRHLPRTHLDGAAMKGEGERPVIGLTLRYDRIDNFWWVLMHELAHVAGHLKDENSTFIDDLRLESSDAKEEEADKIAGEVLIPKDAWENSEANERPTPLTVTALAQELGIHPAIVAGRARHKQRNYRLLSQFVGSKGVNHLFGLELGTY